MRVDESKLRQYLLKNLSEEETEKMDLQFFDDNELENSLFHAEEDLIEDYIDESLSPAERELFQANFLVSNRRREQLAFMSRLKTEIADSAPDKAEKPLSITERLAKLFRPKFPQIVVFASFAIVFAVCAWWFIGANEQNSEIAALNKQDLSDLSSYKNSSNLTLTTDVLRSNAAEKNLQKDLLTEKILLRLILREDVSTIPLLEIHRDANQKFRLENVRVYKNQIGSEIRLLLPSAELEKGAYRVEFEIEKRKTTYNFSIQ